MADTIEGTAESLGRNARQLETLDTLSARFGTSLSGALAASAVSGRELSGTLDAVASSLTAALGKGLGSAAQSTLSTALQSATRSLSESAFLGSFGGDLFPFARGGVVSGGLVTPFASGGVVASPGYFPMRDGLGLVGESGPEAILPLARGPDGSLGIRGGGGGAATVNVTIQTADAESFRRSEAQVAASLARAVSRGRRAL